MSASNKPANSDDVAKRPITVRVSDEMFRALQEFLAAKDVELAPFVRELIAVGIDRPELSDSHALARIAQELKSKIGRGGQNESNSKTSKK